MHIALLTLKETIEGEMNGETVEIGINSNPQDIAHKAYGPDTGIVGAPANDLLGYEGVEGAVGPRFRKLSKEVRTSGAYSHSGSFLEHNNFIHSIHFQHLTCTKEISRRSTANSSDLSRK